MKKLKNIILTRLRVLGLVLIMVPFLGFASVLSDLAATVQPGEFVELQIGGSVSTCQAMIPPWPIIYERDENGNFKLDEDGNKILIPRPDQMRNILEFTDEAHWDSVNQEIYILGTRRAYKPWDQGFVKYSEATNSWTILNLPPFGLGAHGYDNGAIDVARGTLYWSRVAQASNVWSMRFDTGQWTRLPDAPISAGEQSSLDYFPDIDRLVIFDARRDQASIYSLYNADTNQWDPPVSLAEPFGEISHFSEYSPNHGIMFFGGGYNHADTTPNVDESRRFYMLDAAQVVRRLADAPTKLGQFGAGPIQTIDPSTGNLVVFQGEPNPDSGATCPGPGPLPIWEYSLATDTWAQTGTQTLTRLWCALDSVAVPLPEYGVNFIVSVKSETNCKVYLYRHSPAEPAVPTPPSITTQPVSQSAAEGSAVTFNVVASGSATLAYQWYRDGDPIGGASSASYTLDPVLAAYNGAEYHSVVSNELGDVTSSIAELTVVVDTTAPLIESAVVVSPTQVDIRFSEAVTPVSAQMPANYQFSGGIGVLAATLSADNKTVQLQTANLVVDTVYTVTISNIKDTSAAANEIAPGSTVDVVYTPVMNFDNGQWPLDWIPLNQSRWKVEADNGNNALFLYKSDYGPLSGDRLGEYIRSPDSYDDFLFQAQIRTNEGAGNPNADYAMVFGWVDEENYYYMMFNRNQSNTVLFRVVAGERRQLAAATANWLSDDEYHLVEVRRTGNNIEVRFDGNPVLDVMDATFLNGKLGLGSFNDSAYFDDIRISNGASTITDLIFFDSFE
ncbi:MAG: Ig-like domain-containing protein [Xanthomonadales bacterium]|nr:Ig-like domain-containing protein [Xanthomonadales bacterium]